MNRRGIVAEQSNSPTATEGSSTATARYVAITVIAEAASNAVSALVSPVAGRLVGVITSAAVDGVVSQSLATAFNMNEGDEFMRSAAASGLVSLAFSHVNPIVSAISEPLVDDFVPTAITDLFRRQRRRLRFQ